MLGEKAVSYRFGLFYTFNQGFGVVVVAGCGSTGVGAVLPGCAEGSPIEGAPAVGVVGVPLGLTVVGALLVSLGGVTAGVFV